MNRKIVCLIAVLFVSIFVLTIEIGFGQSVQLQLLPLSPIRLTITDLTCFRINLPGTLTAIVSYDVFVVVSVTDASGQMVVKVQTGRFRVTSGSTITFTQTEQPPTQEVFTIPEYESVKRGEEFPVGTYNIELRLLGIDEEEWAKYTTIHTILEFGRNELPKLPKNKVQLWFPRDDARILEQQPTFQWLLHPPVPGVEYRLSIWELQQGQSISEAIQNDPYFEEKGIQNTFFFYPLGARSLDLNKEYCWQVKGSSLSTPIEISDIWRFEKAVAVAMAPISQVFQPMAAFVDTPIFFTYLGDDPQGAQTDWTGDLQGIAHDDNYWYFSQGNEYIGDWLIKYHYSLPINLGCSTTRGGFCKKKPDVLRFWHHYGDLVQYEGFLFVPMDKYSENRPPSGYRNDNLKPIIAVFRAEDLEYIDHDTLEDLSNIGWCAVNPADGCLYTSDSVINENNPIRRYKIDWSRLKNSGDLILELGIFPHTYVLKDECDTPIEIEIMQGGEFSEDGKILYLTSGYLDKHYTNDGINVFRTETWKRIARSTNGFGLFNYKWITGLPENQEPEGITIWDLDNNSGLGGRRLGGQVHVIMLDNDLFQKDDLYLKHYRINKTLNIAENIITFDNTTAIIWGDPTDRERGYILGADIDGGGGAERLFAFPNENDARRALEIIQYYGINSLGFLGDRNNPTMTYFLVNGRSQNGASPGENCLFTFETKNTSLSFAFNKWQINACPVTTLSGEARGAILLEFNKDKEEDARKAYSIIKKYGFTRLCSCGSLKYFR